MFFKRYIKYEELNIYLHNALKYMAESDFIDKNIIYAYNEVCRAIVEGGGILTATELEKRKEFLTSVIFIEI